MATPVHVVVDARMARDSGIGTYIRNTVGRVAALSPEWRFTLLGDRSVLERQHEGWARHANTMIADCRAPIYGIREQFVLRARIPRDAGLYWAPHYNIPTFSTVPLVATVHDLAHLRLPEHTQNPMRRVYARTMYRALHARARAVLCDSTFTLNEYRALVGERTNGAAEVVHAGVDETWFSIPDSPSPEPRPYFLFVGNLKPHKNVGLVLEAMRLAAGPPSDTLLVIIGRRDGMRTRDDTLATMAAALGERVRFLGEVDEDALRRYVKNAAALVFPSLYEGFGLPPLEAMAAGTPAIVSRAASLPEVCGDAALYVDPTNAADLASAMQRVLGSAELREDLARRGRERARGFSWDATARATRDVLARAIEAGDAG